MTTVTSANREEFIENELKKRKPKASVKNDFYSKYKTKLVPHHDYHEFVNANREHIAEMTKNIKDKIATYTGLSEKEKNKKFNDLMRDARNHVTEAWDVTRPQD